jgi:3alpha-hydroxysteroid 3-dehydrogenase
MRTAVITGSATGLGAATRLRLEADGYRVIGVDLSGQEISADLSSPAGRAAAMNAVLAATDRSIDVLVVCADIGARAEPTSLIVSVNYFGSIELLDGLRPALTAGHQPAAVAISSSSIGTVNLDDPALIDVMLFDGEAAAMALADRLHGSAVSAMTKIAVARAVRLRVQPWGQAQVRLNAVASGPMLVAPARSMSHPSRGPTMESLTTPLERSVEPRDIAAAVSFLISADAAAIHGSVLFVDGGTDALIRPELV